MSFLVIPFFAGQINVKLDSKSLYSERSGQVPTIAVLGLRLTWRKWARC